VASDGIPTLARNRVLAQRIVLCVGLVAVFGLIQFATKQLWVDRISIPGLTSGAAAWSLGQRSGLTRPSGTSTSPIEYAVVLTMVLPLAIVMARRARGRRWVYVCLLGAIGFAILLSLSRSAIVCGLVALVVLIAAWPPRARLVATGVVLAMFVAVYLTVPGVLGTIGRLFTGASDDSSIQSRTGSYDIAGDFIAQSPLLGRGFGTFLPKYWILDNGYLGLLIEGGVLGLAGLLAVISAALWLAVKARGLAVDAEDKEIAQALVAGIAAGASGLAFFDTFGFPQTAGSFFLMIGLAGSTWRLTRVEAAPVRLAKRMV
jgi:O-antigen ligase